MAAKKTAIAVPEALLEEVDAMANARGESRSRFITRLLKEAVATKRSMVLEKRLRALFSEDDFCHDFSAAALDNRKLELVGWEDEGW